MIINGYFSVFCRKHSGYKNIQYRKFLVKKKNQGLG